MVCGRLSASEWQMLMAMVGENLEAFWRVRERHVSGLYMRLWCLLPFCGCLNIDPSNIGHSIQPCPKFEPKL